jgi:hypothetical protein
MTLPGKAPAKIMLEKQIRTGANSFYWIAGVQLISGILMGLANWAEPGLSPLIKIATVLLSVAVAVLFVVLGLLARRRYQWSFVIGMTVFALQALVFLWVRDYLSAGIDAVFLFWLWRTLKAIKESARL